MFKPKPDKEQRVSRFRTWKSGKLWLFGASVLTMSTLMMTSQTFAQDAQPDATPSTTTISPDSSDTTFAEVDKLSADQVVNAPQDVRIHYTPNQGDNSNYYAWVWGDNANYKENGRFLPLVAGNDGKHTLTVTPDKDVSKFNYIITNGNNWDQNPNKVSGNDNMTAGVNNVTATDIYHNANGWYSQFQNVQTDEFDRKFGYTDKVVNASGEFETVGSAGNLGATLHDDGTATLNLWAPTAKEVSVNIYRSTAEDAPLLKTLAMTRGMSYTPSDHTKNTVGLWSIKLTSDLVEGLNLSTIAYDYKLTIPKAYFIQKTEDWFQESPGVWKKRGDKYVNSASAAKGQSEELSSTSSIADIAKLYAGDDQIVTIQDPYSQATVKNGKRTVIVNPNRIGGKVTNSNNVRVNSKTELSVVEVDIRDFSIDPSSGVSDTNKGNYLGFVETGTTNPETGKKTGIDYLKYLGAKYIQMMPIYDFQTVPELPKTDPKNNVISSEFSADDQQNWGYDPKNYNVPEGSYATDPDNPTNRIEEVKTMVQKLHDAGINIIMDVVYNHLYDGQNNPFEYTVPGYYYAVNGDGKMNNDIGVGNAVRTNSEMMRQYIVNSVAYWALEYGMDGFRFDAMSDLDTDTMNAIRAAINKIDKRIVTYGEGWNSMGNYLHKDGEHPSSVANAGKTPEVGFFDSIGRDAISGSHYDNENPPGFVNRNSSYKSGEALKTLIDSLMGGHGRSLINASQQLNYVEVHDGMTLSDLLKHYNPNDTPEEHLNRVELATAMSALSQGIHFSQHGQEFLRSKMNSHNTYNAGDEKNKINWNLVSENADAVNFTKSLISLRQNEPLWHLSEYGKEIFSHMTITNAQENSGIITFELRQDNDDKYLVIFNNNTSSDNNSSLTLGPGNYYYGSEISRGRINYSNDFTNAFVVTSNSKNLYDKIGSINGEPTITLDKLSATVLYIPRVRIAHQEHVTQTIHYINKQQESVAKDHVQKVTKAIIEQVDPKQKFSYTTSGIGATDKRVLGYRENILNHVNKENTPIQVTYYATDGKGNLIETNASIRLADSGLPINSDSVTWVREDQINFKEVIHPEINTYRVVETTDDSNSLVKVPEKAINNDDITVTYAKETVAYLISNNDPDKQLPTTKDEALAKEDKHSQGIEGETINLSDSDLTRNGYTYTVNNHQTLAEAVQASNAGKFALNDSKFTVTYTANPGIITVIYLDSEKNNAEVNRYTIEGTSDQTVTFSPRVPENYEIVRDNSAEVTQFDRIDDATNPSQTITVYLRHKHETSEVATTHTVTYQGIEALKDEVVTVTWTVDTDLVTHDKTYTPQTQGETITSPKQEGFRADKKQVTIAPVTQTEQPLDAVTVVTYTPVTKPSTAFDTRTRYTLDGQEQTTVPNPETSTKVSETVTTPGQEAVYNWNADKEEWELTTPATQQVVTHAYVTKTVDHKQNGSSLTSEEKPSVMLQDTIEKKDGLIIKTTRAYVNGESQPTLIKKTAVTDNLTTNDLPSAKLTHKNGSGLTSEEKTSVTLYDTIEKKDGLNIKTTWANVNGEQSKPTLIKKTAVTDNLTTNDLPSAKLSHKNGSSLTSEEKTSVTLQDTIGKKDGLIIKTTWANVNGEQSKPTLIKKTAVTDNLTTNDLPSAKLSHKNGSSLT
ncbi:alpha-amylase family glycosyl hydrolase, partial [Streptococcus fryi]